MSADAEDQAGFLRSLGKDINFAVYETEDLVGFVSIQPHPAGIEIGLGLRPDLTGGGRGVAFVNAALTFAHERHPNNTVILNVATFNKRAIQTYKHAGFTRTKTFMRETNGGTWEFAEMVLHGEDAT